MGWRQPFGCGGDQHSRGGEADIGDEADTDGWEQDPA
jgi:hypothetical protein